MTVSKKQQAHVNKYVAKHYDQIIVRLPKGERDNIKAAADAVGLSVNAYISGAIHSRMEHEADKGGQ